MGLKESGLRASVRSVSTVLPAFFDVVITDTNSPVNEGDVLEVDYDVDNTGESFDTQDIRLEIDDVQEDVDPDVSLSGGDGTSGTLFWDTTGQEADTYSATVLSDDDSDTVTVEIPDAFFDVAITGTNSPVEEGEILDVDYFVENTGGVEDTQDIRLEIDNVEEDRDSDITLNASNSTSGTLNWDTGGEDADTYTATVLSDDDTDSVTVEVESAIPDSAVLHYPFLDRSDSTVSEKLADADAIANGTTNVSNSWWEGWAEDGDGTDDYIEATDWSEVDFNTSILANDFAIIYTIEGTFGDANHWGRRPADAEMSFRIGPINFSGFDGNGEVAALFGDGNANEGAVEGETEINDGNRYRIVFNKITNDPNNWELWVNGSEETVSVRRTGWDAENLFNPSDKIYFHALNNEGSDINHINGVLDNIIVTDNSLDSGEIQDDYNSQPWT